jgi:hypothetical protein
MTALAVIFFVAFVALIFDGLWLIGLESEER